MKKYLLGIFAVVIALGLSSFTTVKKVETKTFDTNYYWFEVKSGYGNQSTLSNPQVIYLQYGSSVMAGSCNTGSRNCRVGFTADQIIEEDPGDVELKPNQGISATAHTRTSL